MSNDIVEAVEEREAVSKPTITRTGLVLQKEKEGIPRRRAMLRPDATEQSTCQIPRMSYHQDSRRSRKMGVVWNSGRDVKRRRSWGDQRPKDDRKSFLGLIGDNSVVEDNSLVQGNDNRRGSWRLE